jgi:hypothetical protein
MPVSGTVATTQSGAWSVSPGTGTYPVSGTIAASQSGTWTVQPGNTQNTTPWLVQGASATTSLINTYTPGQQYLTQTTTGTLRVDLSTLGGTTLTQTGGAPDVNVKSIGGSAANMAAAGEQRVSAEISGTSNTVVLGAGSAAVGTVSLAAGSGIVQSLSVAGSTVSVGYAVGAGSLPVSIQNATLAATQSGTWTVQPGNTANSTPWLVDPSHAVDSTLNASVSIKGSSNTVQITGTPAVNITQVGGASVTQGAAGQLRNSVEISGSSNTVQGGLADNGAAAATNRIAVLGGITQTSYENGTAATQGRNSAQSHGTDGLVWTAQLPSMRPAWFSASTNTWTLASTPTDITALCGNASNTVIVTGLSLSCTQTTAGNVTVQVLKRSTKFVGAWSTMTVVSMNSNYAVTNSTPVFFTANPTVGTLLAPIDSVKMGFMAAATASPNDIYMSPPDWNRYALALNGAAECVTVNLGGLTATGGVCSARWTWIETATITP